MATKTSVHRSATSGKFVTASGRTLMNPVRGSKLSAAEIDRAIQKVRQDEQGAEPKRGKK